MRWHNYASAWRNLQLLLCCYCLVSRRVALSFIITNIHYFQDLIKLINRYISLCFTVENRVYKSVSVATFSRWLKDLFSRAEEESCRSDRVGFSHRLQASATIESMSEPLTFLIHPSKQLIWVNCVHSQALDSGQKESATTILHHIWQLKRKMSLSRWRPKQS